MAAAALPLAGETEERLACELSGVTKAFGAVRAVDDVSLDVVAGSLTCLIGPNGAGKSTLLGCVSGLHPVDGGAVRIDGHDVTRWPPHRRARHGLATVFQTTRPLAQLDVLDNAAVGAHVRSRTGFVESMLRPPWQWREQRRVRDEARDTLAIIGLDERADDPAAVLPLGQLRLLDRARHARHRRLVEHHLDPLHGPARRPRVRAVAVDDLHVLPHRREVLTLAREEVVEDADGVAVAHQALGEMAPDEARAAGDEDLHGASTRGGRFAPCSAA